jgi:hypothetical protein
MKTIAVFLHWLASKMELHETRRQRVRRRLHSAGPTTTLRPSDDPRLIEDKMSVRQLIGRLWDVLGASRDLIALGSSVGGVALIVGVVFLGLHDRHIPLRESAIGTAARTRCDAASAAGIQVKRTVDSCRGRTNG